MRDIYEKITKEMYDYYMSTPRSEWLPEVEKKLPASWVMGYGYYGTDLAIRDGEYYLVYSIGSSCD